MQTTSPSQTEEPSVPSNFIILTTSVVLVAEPHNPAIISPDFLRNKGIVPAEWVPSPDPVCTPAFTHVDYPNKLSILVDPGRCTFGEVVNGAPKGDYLVHQCAREYAKQIEYNYSALGMNWQVGLVHDNPSDWLKNRFFRPGAWQNDLGLTSIAFSAPAPGSAICNFTLQAVPQPPQANLTQINTVLNCNFHFELKGISEKTARISDILTKGKDYESFLAQSIAKYLVEDLA